MNYGLYLSAGGALASLHKQDVLANNLANINTVGFKPDLVNFRARLPERLESPTPDADPQLLLEQLGGGQFTDPTRIDFHQGDLAQSHSDLDMAIQGDGFFVVSNGKGSGADNLRFTRDGRFTLNSAGELVMITNGMRVLDPNDQPIRLNRSAKLQVDGAGNILQNGAAIAKVQISTIADKSNIVKEGSNVMRFAGAKGQAGSGAKRQPASGSVKQGWVESSGVDPILAMNAMINVSKAIQANSTMMQYHDNIMGQAINTFARVA